MIVGQSIQVTQEAGGVLADHQQTVPCPGPYAPPHPSKQEHAPVSIPHPTWTPTPERDDSAIDTLTLGGLTDMPHS